MTEFKRTLVTSALPYANGPVHIGHLAGVYLPADIYVRYLRLRGEDVLHVCGSDEHGVPITIKAREQGVSPQTIVDKYHKIIKDSLSDMGINFDIYSRTTSPVHHKNAADFFRTLYDGGKLISKETEQYYDPEVKTFLADRYIVGTCPKCGNPGAYGDQCEKCGSTLSPEELVDPHSKLSGAAPIKVKTKHWYLPLEEDEEWLKDWILKGHKEWKTNVYGQCKSWLDGGLQARAVSRDLDWGVPLPIDGAEGKVLYVWFDAPIGYISNTQELLPDTWEKWWKDPQTRMVHMIGKDNIVFHCIIFPSMLKRHGEYNLPDNVPANEFLNLESNKISTSKNWAVWVNEYVKDFPGQEDVLRYVLCANMPQTKDNDFTWKDFQQRNNSELVAVFGNFVNRAMVLARKYFDGKVPPAGELLDVDREAVLQMAPCKAALEANMDTFHFREALKEAMNLARVGNKYISDTAPWAIAKTDLVRTGTILNLCLQMCAGLAVAFEPFLPFSSEKLRKMLRVGIDAGRDYRRGEGTPTPNFYTAGEGKALHTIPSTEEIVLNWDMIGSLEILPAGHQLGQTSLLFSMMDHSVVETQTAKLQAREAEIRAAAKVKAQAEAAKKVEAQKEEVSFNQFDAMDIRTATVIAAERVPKTDKLLKLTLDTGMDQRTIVSGIAEYYTPEQMVGKQICILANLQPRKIRGVESMGMILMAKQGDGSMRIISPEEPVINGAQVG